MEWDVFICHASEDKAAVARPLARALRHQGLKVWFDEFVLKVGDSLRGKIDDGLAASRYGIVIISPAFLAKKAWTEWELAGLVARSDGLERFILPVWHDVNTADVKRYSPPLADKIAARTGSEIAEVAARIVDAMVTTPLAGGHEVQPAIAEWSSWMDDAEQELRGLLEQALTVASSRQGEWIGKRARELGGACGSPEALSLVSRIEQTLRASLCPRPQPQFIRLRRLEAELARDGDTSPGRLFDALVASGLSVAVDLSPRECQEAGKLLFQPLQALSDRYRRHGGLNVEGLHAVLSDLEKLAEALPDHLASVRAEVDRLRGVVSSKVAERQAEQDVVGLVELLQREVIRQEHLDGLTGLESRLHGNAWVRHHPDHDLVKEAEELLARLEQVAATHAWVAGLPQRVTEALGSASQSQAADELQAAAVLAEKMQLLDRNPLEAAAGLLIESFRQTCRIVERATRGRDPIPTDVLLRRLDELARAREASRRIPDALQQGLAVVERQIQELSHRIEERLGAEALRAVRERFESLAPDDLATYVAELDASSLPGIDVWREGIVKLAADLEEAGGARRPIPKDVLERLEGSAEKLGTTPVTRTALVVAASHRRALALCEEIRGEIEAGSVEAGRRLADLEQIILSMPDWGLPRDLAAHLRDADLVERVQQRAASGRPEDFEEAARLAAGLTDAADRQRYAGAARSLNTLALRLAGAARLGPALEGGAEARELWEAINRGVQAVGGLLSQEQRTVDAQRILEAGWQVLESEGAWLMGALPSAIRRWMDSVAPAAQGLDEILAGRRTLDGWLEVLADDFLRDDGDRLFGRRQAEIEIDELHSQGRLPEALEVLRQHRELLSDATGLEDRLQREFALAQWTEGGDPGLEGMVEIAGRHGLDARMADVFVEQFRERGPMRLLAALDRSGAPQLERFVVLAALARWSRSQVSHGPLDELVCRLVDPANDPEALRLFVMGLGRTESAEARALGLLERLGEAAGRLPSEVADELGSATAGLATRIQAWLDEFASSLENAKSRYDTEPARSAEAASQSDSALERSFRAVQEEARLALDAARTTLESLRDELAGASPWLLPSSDLGRRLHHLSGAVDTELDRVMRDRETLTAVDGVVTRMLEDQEPDAADELADVLRNVGSQSTAVIRRMRRVVTEYFFAWRFVVRDFSRLLAARERGGEGLSRRDLQGLVARLEDEYRYDFRPGQDRFRLRTRLGGAGYPAFCEELEQMVGEIEVVDDWSARLKDAIRHNRPELERRLKKVRGASGAEDKRLALDSLRGLLDSKGLKRLFDTRPKVEVSAAARERLTVVEGGGGLALVAEAIDLVGTDL